VASRGSATTTATSASATSVTGGLPDPPTREPGVTKEARARMEQLMKRELFRQDDSTDAAAAGGPGSSASAAAGSVKPVKLRSPGINQTGPILGLGPEVRGTEVVVGKMDRDALKAVLDDEE
jgi:hypothetical protein